MGRDGTEAGVVLSVTCEAGAGAGSKKTIAELPQEPMRGYKDLVDEGARFKRKNTMIP